MSKTNKPDVFVVAYQGPVYADFECDMSYYNDPERVSEDCNDIRAVFGTYEAAEDFINNQAAADALGNEWNKKRIQHEVDFHWQIYSLELDKYPKTLASQMTEKGKSKVRR